MTESKTFVLYIVLTEVEAFVHSIFVSLASIYWQRFCFLSIFLSADLEVIFTDNNF